MVATTIPCASDFDWERQAACKNIGTRAARAFFSDEIHDIATAKRICATCGVVEECLTTAVNRGEQWGIWGGQLFISGKIMATKRRRGRPPKVTRVEDDLPVVPFPESLKHLQPA